MPRRAAFAFIFVTVLLDMVSLGIMVPVLPKLVVQFSNGDVARAARISGAFGVAWAAMQFLCAPALGALSDRFGRRPVILASNFGLGLDYLAMALAPSLPWLFLGRLVSGATAATVPTAGAYIADVTPPEQRAARFGILGAAFGAGFVIGPAIGGWLGAHDLRLPFWVCGALSLLNFGYGLVVLPESHPPERRVAVPLANPFAALRGMRALGRWAAVAFAFSLAHEVLPAVFVLYPGERFRWDADTTGAALALVGVTSMIVNGALVSPLVARLGELGALRLALAAVGIGFVIYAVAPTGAVLAVAIPFVGVGGLFTPALQAILSRTVGADEQGRLQGVLGGLRGVTGMIGPLLFTQAYAASIGRFDGAPWAVAAALVAAALALTARPAVAPAAVSH